MELIERWLYDVPEPPKRTRDRPMKILALGMSRSGTESLSRALRILGYDHVFHGFEMWQNTPMLWKGWTQFGRRKWGQSRDTHGTSGLTRADFDSFFGHCEAITDQPGAIFAPELIAAYPEAKVILNHRNVDAWHRSFCTVLRPLTTGLFYHVLPYFNANLYWEAQYLSECVKSFYHGSWERHGKWVYEQHNATIRGMVPADRLLEWTVEDGWEPLCRFLEKEVPPDEFPSGNTVDNTHDSHDNDLLKCVVSARRNLSLCIACVGVLVAVGLGRRVNWGQWIRAVDVRASINSFIAF
ncbi:P-loop containing nucleoside triphosphate hydrolase protein [Aspergillus avenaceus]|uniref:P-loop containing nucleoside triphosphate hydrolase protein n=1 Tax=Aspergillus avenaceus TaxID=36643 RepID=A0A5N6U570_ASPAV|nr:P-loop containing nucleoside triphosphate hydrolase protein [Aspergillus avenaceus]